MGVARIAQTDRLTDRRPTGRRVFRADCDLEWAGRSGEVHLAASRGGLPSGTGGLERRRGRWKIVFLDPPGRGCRPSPDWGDDDGADGPPVALGLPSITAMTMSRQPPKMSDEIKTTELPSRVPLARIVEWLAKSVDEYPCHGFRWPFQCTFDIFGEVVRPAEFSTGNVVASSIIVREFSGQVPMQHDDFLWMQGTYLHPPIGASNGLQWKWDVVHVLMHEGCVQLPSRAREARPHGGDQLVGVRDTNGIPWVLPVYDTPGDRPRACRSTGARTQCHAVHACNLTPPLTREISCTWIYPGPRRWYPPREASQGSDLSQSWAIEEPELPDVPYMAIIPAPACKDCPDRYRAWPTCPMCRTCPTCPHRDRALDAPRHACSENHRALSPDGRPTANECIIFHREVHWSVIAKVEARSIVTVRSARRWVKRWRDMIAFGNTPSRREAFKRCVRLRYHLALTDDVCEAVFSFIPLGVFAHDEPMASRCSRFRSSLGDQADEPTKIKLRFTGLVVKDGILRRTGFVVRRPTKLRRDITIRWDGRGRPHIKSDSEGWEDWDDKHMWRDLPDDSDEDPSDEDDYPTSIKREMNPSESTLGYRQDLGYTYTEYPIPRDERRLDDPRKGIVARGYWEIRPGNRKWPEPIAAAMGAYRCRIDP